MKTLKTCLEYVCELLRPKSEVLLQLLSITGVCNDTICLSDVFMQMSPKDLTQDNSEDNRQQHKPLNPSVDNTVDSIAFGHQSDQRSTSSDTPPQQTAEEVSTELSPRLMKNHIFGLEMPFDVISAAFASTVAIGGLIGYLKAKSTYSLIAGLVFGGILGFGAYQTSVNPRNYYLTLGTSIALGALMGYRAINSGKFMPAGLIASLSALMILRFTVRYFTDTNYIRK
ncbi:unnamed protein product [Oppiella nova]|uniref:Transmembrane protein 14C n=1 Tax=Oppiella nova TaxID=334625 RepID=A0A7R9MCP0_9ACAR|nr:unnamed protein product [Oppiella nova]CAG2174924.1 unnamed protein product [Oppiella nova]